MRKIGLIALVNILVLGAASVVAEESDKELFAQGNALFDANCVLCHQSSGKGIPPAFPALAGNKNLQDLSLIVTNIHKGQGAMPAFPQLSAEEIAALATYIRNAWGNEFGGVRSEAVAAFLADQDGGEAVELRSVWDGVYTKEQANRGEPLYAKNCAECHGDTPVAGGGFGAPIQSLTESEPSFLLVSDPEVGGFASAPPLAGGVFLRGWKGQTVATLYQYARTGMPQDSPGSLSDQQYVDIIAYMFGLTDLPTGESELLPDAQELIAIIIEPVATKLGM
ncbi:MAG TPA: c-type cytochrome [Alphaproteobacteria bacterium]|nr:c-type cytochrome [Alphaproteobacteria bacterium]